MSFVSSLRQTTETDGEGSAERRRKEREKNGVAGRGRVGRDDRKKTVILSLQLGKKKKPIA